MKGILVAALAVLTMVLAGCGSQQIDYSPKPSQAMTRQQAAALVEQVFYEDYGKQRPEYVEINDDFILLSDGVVSNSSGFGSAAAVGSGAIVAGNSRTVTKAAGQRIYWRTLDQVTIHQKRGRSNRFVLVLRNADGGTLRYVNVRTLAIAKDFVDAVQVLKSPR